MLGFLFEALFGDDITGGKPYAERVVGRTEPADNGGIGVSTCWTADHSYETALLDANGAHPVERYASKEAAAVGHAAWVGLACPGRRVRKLGVDGPYGRSEDEDVVLEAVAP